VAAFTDAEKASIRRYLGFSEAFHQINTMLESMMDDLASRSPAAQTQVIAILGQLAAVDAKLQHAALINLNFVSGDGAVFQGPAQIDALQDYGRTLVQHLAITFEVTPRRDYYGAEAGAGGVIPLG
jgi:hypothetical protein